ncbi:NAD(P)-dependent oxidoreductase [Bradyrhizobium sp. 187]|uniref:NAD(P)-dependent oxidoreductase n=1 Tax=Bradyrhizobium sp. 187 TaxID=2782655 RepID=UPI001FFFA47D|nr:NAD(P)-dependent oxidoreductase [Bradyrhizobium sp. 187]UPJ71867.1 NAD(P)-dependent oxidoreductase [Bradyrhizobium sp. 187]
MIIGIAGLGRMGSAIAARLIECGNTVAVWNRSPGKADALVTMGAGEAKTPADLTVGAEVIITMLTDPAAIDAVYRGKDGLLRADIRDKLFIDMSTVTPSTEERLARDVREHGAAIVECPVGGTIAPARSGQLLGFAGGTKVDIERAMPLLEQLCRRVDHVGDIGAGSSTKLAINLMLLVFYQTFGEAYSMIKHLGHSPSQIVEMLADTPGGANVLRIRGHIIAAALGGDLSEPAAFELATARKDIALMMEDAESRGHRPPLTARALELFDEAISKGWGTRDVASFAAYWQSTI